MTIEHQIATAYANHLILNFGTDALALFRDIPTFKAFSTVSGVAVVVSPDKEAALSKAIEVYARQTGLTVFMNGLKFTPHLSMAA